MTLALTVPSWLEHGIVLFGYWVVFAAVAIESLGIPFPGETSLLAAAIYASTTHRLSIVLVIVAAAAGAIVGDNIGYSIGRVGGYPLVQRVTRTRVARALHITDTAFKAAQRFFATHGDKTVFFGRFFSLLRVWVAFLAGVNRMPRSAFMFWNVLGGIIWAIVYGTIGYVLGRNLHLLNIVLAGMGIAGLVAFVAAIIAIVAFWVVYHRREQRLLRALDEQDETGETSETSSEMVEHDQRSTTER